jgi:hypothetical protein
MPTAWDNGIAARFVPKRYTSRELVKLAEEFGWRLINRREGRPSQLQTPGEPVYRHHRPPAKGCAVGRAVDTVKKIRLEIK